MGGLRSRDITAAGKAGTLRDIAQTIRNRKARNKAAEAEEEISNIRVPINRVRPQAISSPIGEAIEGRKAQDQMAVDSQAEGQVVAPEEQAAAQDQFDETNRAIQEKKDLEVKAVDDLPLMKSLAPYPSAKNKVMQLAEANGWVKMIGGVATISNKQMQLAQGIIAGDLKLRKNINELALNDITQNIQSLQQAKLDPKLKEEDMANIDAQLQSLAVEQNNKLNAVNMMDRKIQQELAVQQPVAPKGKSHKTKTEQLGDGKMQDWERVDGEWVKFGEVYSKGKSASTGWGSAEWNSYRQYLKQAESSAYRDIFSNDPKFKHEMAEWESGGLSPEESKQFEARLHTALTPTQRAKLDELTEKYLAGKTPKPMLDEWLSAKKRGEKHTVESDPIGLRKQ